MPLPFSGPSIRGWSEQDLIRCPQRWAFSRLLRLPSAPSPALMRGGLVHEGIMHYWLGRTRHPEALDPVFSVRAKAAELGWADEHVGIACDAVRRFADYADVHLASMQVLGIEHPGELWCADGAVVPVPADAEARREAAQAKDPRAFYAMGAPWLSTFRADLIALDAGGRPIIIDWKTGYRFDAMKRRGFDRSGQFLQYHFWGRAAYGDGFGGVWIGAIDLGAVESGKGKPISLIEVPFAPWPTARWPRAVSDRAEHIARLLAADRDPNDFPRAYSEQGPCTDRYGVCPYWDACGGSLPDDG